MVPKAKNFFKYKHSLIVLGEFFILLTPRLGMAVGVSPALVEVADILPNQTVNKQVHISRANPESDIQALVTASGSAADYIDLSNNGVVELPQGEQLVPYSFAIKTEGLLPGTYQAALAINPVSDADSRVETEIMAGAQAEIQFTVASEEIESYTIQEVSMEGVKENQQINFSYLMVNTGNVDTRPSRIDFQVTNEKDPTSIYSETIDKQELPLVPAFQEKKVELTTRASLSADLYDTKITFYDNSGESTYIADTIRLQVLGTEPIVDQQKLLPGTLFLWLTVFLLVIVMAIVGWRLKKNHQ